MSLTAQYDGSFALQVGDEILEINGRSTEAMTQAEAVNMIRLCSDKVKLYIRRPQNPQIPGMCYLTAASFSCLSGFVIDKFAADDYLWIYHVS